MNSPAPIKSKETLLIARFIGNILLKKANTFTIFLINPILFSPQKEYLHPKSHSATRLIVQYNLKKFPH